MKRDQIKTICARHNVALCYIFGSQQKNAAALLNEEKITIHDREADIDFAVLFAALPHNPLEEYARLSLDLQDIVSPFKADLLFLHEVDHLIQMEAIRGMNIYARDEEFRETYEQRVLMLASDEFQIFKRNEKDFFEAIDDGYFEFEYKTTDG